MMKEVIMSKKEVLINEIQGLPDFIIEQLSGIVRYIKIGIENEYISKTNNDFYNSVQFKNIVSESIAEYRSGKTENMDISLA
jgi:hypothetical protein